MERRNFLDNIRWATVLLVVVYHVVYVFNACGVLGGFAPFEQVQWQDALLPLVYPWFMVLLYAVAGASARYALQKRTVKQFIRSRTVKLLVPSTLGLLVFQWLGGWVNMVISGAFEQFPADMPFVVKYLIAALSGTGPLWFAQLLWVFSLLLPLVRRLDRRDRFYQLCGKATLPVLLGLALPVWAASFVLNAPVITVYRFGIYFAAFLLGYFVLSHDEVQQRLAQSALPLITAAAALGAAYTVCWFGKDYTSDACLQSPFTAIYLWIAVLAVFGAAKKWYNGQNKVTAFFSRISFGMYALHYPVMTALCWVCRITLGLPAWAVYTLALAGTLTLTPVLYQVIRRIPVVRWCVLGERKE